MEIAAVHALAELARQEQSDVVAAAYGGIEDLSFGPEYLIPEALRPAPDRQDRAGGRQGGDGLGRRHAADRRSRRLCPATCSSSSITAARSWQPIFAAARKIATRRAAASSTPRARTSACCGPRRSWSTRSWRPRSSSAGPAVIERAIKRHGLRMRVGEHFTVVNPEHDARYREYWQEYHRITRARRRHRAIREARNAPAHDADRRHAAAKRRGRRPDLRHHLHHGAPLALSSTRSSAAAPGASVYGAMSGLILPGRQVFLVDTHVNLDPTAEELAEITELAADQLRAFGLVPKVALLSHSNFGSSDAPSALKMRAALALLSERAPELEVDGEMHGDCALDEAMRKAVLPDSTLRRQRQSAGLPESGQRQHRLQPAQVRRGQQRGHRTDAARLCGAGAHLDRRRRPCGASST